MNPLSYFYTLRSYVDAYAGFLGRRFLSLVWVVAACVVIWFYGYLLGFGDFKPLAGARARLIVIALILFGWLAFMAVSYMRGRRKDRALAEDIAEDPEAMAESRNRGEVQEIRTRLKEALALLRKVTKKRFGYVYELPWYVIVGAPGAGKTTALANSGLKFPLGDALGGEGAVQGVGGTRNCKWWFSEDAILVDTAGRYTTQDDLDTTSKAGWEGLLKLLKTHRASQPINGVIVTLSISDLLTRDAQARLEEMRAIRQRLSELDAFLGARVPVYVLMTKADLLTGFVEFFDGLGRTDRDQVWGMTFDLAESYAGTDLSERFLEEYGLLQERVGAMLLERLQQEPDNAVRGRIFQFPAQFAALKEKLHEIMQELCSGLRLVEAPLVRGVYFASAMQESEAAPAAARPGRMRRSYFLSRLFSGVIFAEAALVARDNRLTRREVLMRRLAYGAAAALTAVIFISWMLAYFDDSRAIALANERIGDYERLARNIPVRNVDDTDFLQVLPALDALASATDGFRREGIWPAKFGLDQKNKLEGRHRAAYHRALNGLLLPRLMVYLQDALQDTAEARETFDDLKLYGMLGGLGELDPDFVVARSRVIFESLYPGGGRAAAREALEGHVTAMVAGRLPPFDIDAVLLERARRAIGDRTTAERAYDILRAGPAARALKPWVPAVLGPGVEQSFERASGESLREGIDGLYTRAGFRDVVLPHIGEAARAALDEGWVRGASVQSAGTVSDVTRDALQLYMSDFERRWARYLADLRVRSPNRLSEASEIARLLAGEADPILALAASVAEATALGASENTHARAALASLPVGADAIPDPYQGLREAVQEPAEGESRISALTPVLEALYVQLSRAATSTATVAEVFDVDGQLAEANQRLLGDARRLPRPVDVWMAGFAADISGLAVKTARTSLGRAWETSGAPACRDAVAGRYPFDRSSGTDMAMDDFVRLFGPDGIFDSFFKTRLAPFVDTSTSPWQWRGAFGTAGTPSDSLAQFENADAIRQAFFPAGSNRPEITISLTPASLSQVSNAVMVEIADERVVYFHGPVRGKSITWPGASDSTASRVVFQPGGWDRALTKNGEWSPFRLFDAAMITRERNNRFHARFDIDGQTASFDVQFGSALAPFRLSAIANFQCPTSL